MKATSDFFSKGRLDTMKKVELKDVKTYEAPGHFGMTAMRLVGTEETGAKKFWMGLSHFLPRGGAQWAYEDSPLEKVYFVLKGEITVKTKTEEIVLRESDTLFIGPHEGREVINRTNLPASLLVVVNYPES
jgi:glyoxylate utilization-related uncharacterized protein